MASHLRDMNMFFMGLKL